MVSSHQEQQTTHHPTFMQYVLVAIILFAITIVEFVLIYDKVGIDWDTSDALAGAKVPVLIALSAIKFAIVIMFYMHLKFDARLFTGIFLAGLALAFAAGLALLGIFVAIDGEPREFAEANAEPYVLHESKTSEPSGPINLDIGVNGDLLEFDTTSFTATAGSEVVLTFSNGSTNNQHNWVLVQDGTKNEVATRGTANPTTGWLEPNDPNVIANTRLLNAGTSGEVSFIAPPAGTYQFVCTFPGHSPTMFGDFEVTEATSAEGAKTTEAAASETGEAGGDTKLQISVPGDALEFGTTSLTASAGSEVVLTLSNVSTAFQHNWVLVLDGTKDDVAGRGTSHPTTDWVQPDDPDVIAHTKLLDSGTTGSVTFAAPPSGTYQFVCTFPGHNFTMFGDFEVTQ